MTAPAITTTDVMKNIEPDKRWMYEQLIKGMTFEKQMLFVQVVLSANIQGFKEAMGTAKQAVELG